ncbi:MAG: DegT/DnrJ/EryC1/StrS aminotransferase family protein [Elusimicrobia bacterium]|nr:DegT/DnrJ/EryC1/StrS aminotransferase family protein [Elusimicrobiota bacterium]
MIPHSRPSVGKLEANAAARVIRSGIIIQNVETTAFEKEMARFLGVRGAVAVSSGTVALALALRALGVKEKDETLVPSFACSALAHACALWGAKAVPADIDLSDYNLSFDDAKRKMTHRTRAVVLTNSFGAPVHVKDFLKLGVPVIEDLAQALGASAEGKRLGGMGAAGILSFYATKLMTTGEGGMVVSNDPALLERVRDLRDYDEKPSGGFHFNFKMTDIQAAIGRVQLKRLPEFLKARRRLADFYRSRLAHLDCELPVAVEGRVYHRYVIRIVNGQAQQTLPEFHRLGVMARRAIHRPLHMDSFSPGRFPVTEKAWKEALSLPIYPSLTPAEARRVAQACLNVFKTR